MGRMLASGYLAKRLNILCALRLSNACKHNINIYYKAFEKTNHPLNYADLTIFIIDFLNIYLLELKELEEQITIEAARYNKFNYIVEKHFDKKYHLLLNILLQITLFDIEGMSIDVLSEAINKTKPTIRKLISEINNQTKLIIKDVSHKPYLYTIDLETLETFK